MDDGSAVIAVHHDYQKSSTVLPHDRQQVRSSRKGKERQMDNDTGGIPGDYLLPPAPSLRSTEETCNIGKEKSGKLINVADAFEIGILVSIVGRIGLWLNRKERVIFVDKVLPAKTRQDKAEHEGSIQLVKDPNEEPLHLLSALHLSVTEYCKTYDPPDNAMSRISLSFAARDKVERTANTSRAFVRGEEVTRKLRVMEDVTEASRNGAQKRALGMVRRPESDKQKEKLERRAKKRREEVKIEIDSKSQSNVSAKKIKSPTGRSRQLRHYMKLNDSKMTDSTFRIYVEKHIVDLYCSGTSAAPSPFTLEHLLQVPELRGHAERTVEVLTRRREEKRKRLQEGKVGKTGKTCTASHEDVGKKMKRLYASVLQAMLLDGIIVLALPVTDIPRTNRMAMQEDAYQVVTPALLATPIYEILSHSPSANLSSIQLVEKLQATDERWRYVRCESVQEGMQFLLKGAVM